MEAVRGKEEERGGASLTTSPEESTEDSGAETPDQVISKDEERGQLTEFKTEPTVAGHIGIDIKELKCSRQKADPQALSGPVAAGLERADHQKINQPPEAAPDHA